MKGNKKHLSVFLILILALLVSIPAFGGTGDPDPQAAGAVPAAEEQAAPEEAEAEDTEAVTEEAPAEEAAVDEPAPAAEPEATAEEQQEAASEAAPAAEATPEEAVAQPDAEDEPAEEPAKDEEAKEDPYTLQLYGYNFGGLYKQPRYPTFVVIGYPEDLLGDEPTKERLTLPSIDALKDQVISYSDDGFGLEDEGLVKRERNENTGWMYDIAGFVPVKRSEITELSDPDAYNDKYVFDTIEDANKAIKDNKGVLYGEKPSAETVEVLKKEGADGGMAIVWQRHDRRGFKSVSLSAAPTEITIGEGVDLTLTPSFSGVLKGDYKDNPLSVTLKLDDGMTYTADEIPSIADTDVFTVNPSSVTVSEDRKELTFKITEIKEDSSKAVLSVPVKVDVTDQRQQQDTVSLSAKNGWKETKRSACTVDVLRPLVKTMWVDGKAVKDSKELSYADKDQKVTLRTEYSHVTSGETSTHIKVTFPDLVTVKSAVPNASSKNKIQNLKVTDASVLEYDVIEFGSESNATDLIDLILDVKKKGEKNEETAETVCEAKVADEDAVVTQNAGIIVRDSYFEVILYGPQDGYRDMNRGDGHAWSTRRTLRFYGANDETALTMHEWSFDDEPLKSIMESEPDGAVMIGPKVFNYHTSARWTLVGFVPINYWSGEIRDRWDPLYGEYYLTDMDACKKLIKERHGIEYGVTPDEDQAKELAKYTANGKAKVICVWYVEEPPVDGYKKYQYEEKDEYVETVHPAAYTKTSDGIETTIETGYPAEGLNAYPYNITFTIPEDFEPDNKEGIVTLNTEFNNAIDQTISDLQPGDKVQYNIKVIDKSGRFAYLDGSGAAGTIDYYNTKQLYKWKPSVVGHGFEDDGNGNSYLIENADKLPGGWRAFSRIPRRGGSGAIRKLADISGVKEVANKPTDENVGKALYALEYGKDSSVDEENPDYVAITREYLDDYYLDYLNAVYNSQNGKEDSEEPHYKSFDQLSIEEFSMLFNADNSTQCVETNPVLVNAMYYGVYEHTMLISPVEKGLSNYLGLWSWMHGWNAETEGNRFEEIIANQYAESAEPQEDGSVEHTLSWYWWITPSRNGNNTQNTHYGTAYQFKLQKVEQTTSLELTKSLDSYMSGSAQGADSNNITLAFKITGTDPKTGETIYEKHVGMTFGSNEPLTKSVTIEGVPKNADITVTEEYSAGYTGGGTVTVELNDDGVYEVDMKNDNPPLNPGSGAVNRYEKTDNGFTFVKDDPEPKE